MTQIVANGEHTKIITNDLEVYVKGEYEIKITPSAGTLDVNEKIKNAVNQLLRIEGKEQLS